MGFKRFGAAGLFKPFINKQVSNDSDAGKQQELLFLLI
jgi:hypothetical protein